MVVRTAEVCPFWSPRGVQELEGLGGYVQVWVSSSIPGTLGLLEQVLQQRPWLDSGCAFWPFQTAFFPTFILPNISPPPILSSLLLLSSMRLLLSPPDDQLTLLLKCPEHMTSRHDDRLDHDLYSFCSHPGRIAQSPGGANLGAGAPTPDPNARILWPAAWE